MACNRPLARFKRDVARRALLRKLAVKQLLGLFLCAAEYVLAALLQFPYVGLVAGYALLDIAVSFVWFALWNPQASWTFFIPLPVLAVLLAAAMFLCFVFSAPPGGR